LRYGVAAGARSLDKVCSTMRWEAELLDNRAMPGCAAESTRLEPIGRSVS